MRVASCFFIGHRETSDAILPYIAKTAERLILEENVTAFYAGGYGNFDRLASEAIIQLNDKAVYACVNFGEAYCPAEIEDRSICIDGDIGEVLNQMK